MKMSIKIYYFGSKEIMKSLYLMAVQEKNGILLPYLKNLLKELDQRELKLN
jgi:hypothetical protein